MIITLINLLVSTCLLSLVFTTTNIIIIFVVVVVIIPNSSLFLGKMEAMQNIKKKEKYKELNNCI